MLEAIENVTPSDDLRQLRGFYEYLESAVFLPLPPPTWPGRTGD
jgi:hypothetical protein